MIALCGCVPSLRMCLSVCTLAYIFLACLGFGADRFLRVDLPELGWGERGEQPT
jgi:hypothetical protein